METGTIQESDEPDMEINAIKLAFGEAIQEWDAHILRITAVKFSVYKAQGWTGP